MPEQDKPEQDKPEQDKPEQASGGEFARGSSNAPSTQPPQDNFEATISIHASAAGGQSNSYDTNPQSTSHVSRVRKSGASGSHSSSVLALPVVRAFSRYRDVQFVGEGTFGAVFKATDSVLDRAVAIKVLKLDAPQGLFKFFVGEAQRLAKLDHPGIRKVFDFGVESGQPYIVTEWLSVKSLADQPKPMEWRSACNVVAQIADAMAYAHRHDVIHRDLKPPNVMIDAEGRARVIDFGLAVNEDELTSQEVCFGGSPAYMAPEQTNGRLHVLDGRVDVWAMGVILYELVTSRRPFRGQTSSDLMSKIREKPVVSPRTFDALLPLEVEQIILASLAKRPEKRTATAGDLAAQLRALLTPSSASPATNVGLSPKPAAATPTTETTNETTNKTSLRSSTNNDALATGRRVRFLMAAFAVVAFCATAWQWNRRGPHGRTW